MPYKNLNWILLMNLNTNTNIIESIEIDRVIAIREHAISLYKESLSKAAEAIEILKTIPNTNNHFPHQCIEDDLIDLQYPRNTNDDDNRTRFELWLDRKIWKMFIDKSGIKTIMSNKQIVKLHYDLYDMKSPIFNFENALSTFTSLSANKADSFKNGLMDALQSVSWDYKSNNPRYLGKKIIMDNAVSVGKHSTRFNKTDTVNDLVRIFCILQKKPIHEFHNSVGLYISDNVRTNNKNFETEFFIVKWYKKGTMHLLFKSESLINNTNDLIAKLFPSALPPL
ncbi:DUF4942 domain-containing protein [Proteus mirabilis]|uniref:DUF4942 domain-containing protein n=2 Tax=Proteus mirabilis TaxID=584 RepID=UPI0034D4DB28